MLARVLRPVGNVIRPILRLGCRAFAFQAASHPAARTGCIAFALAPHCALALAIARHLSACSAYADKSAWRDQRVSVRSIGNLDAKVSQRASDRVGGGEVPTISGCGPLFQQLVDQERRQPSSAGRSSGLPDLAVGIQAQDHQHAVHVAEMPADLITIICIESLVAFPDGIVQHRHRRGCAKIIIHCVDELVRYLWRPAAYLLGGSINEVVDPAKCGHRLGDRRIGILDRRAVVRLNQVQPHGARAEIS